MIINDILLGNDNNAKRTLFSFNKKNSPEEIRIKFNLWAKFLFPRYFKVRDARFHKIMDLDNINAYRGDIRSFTDLAFRGAAKTGRTKLFVAFAICNDLEHSRQYFKILSQDGNNAKQFVTDVYNLLVDPMLSPIYPEVFANTDDKKKREETMESFTTTFGVKLVADTIGSSQRGALQDASRPDFIIFDDIETRTTLYSGAKTNTIWLNIEEARNGLAKGGSYIVLGNYISELGNIHKLVLKGDTLNRVFIQPIKELMNGVWVSAWPEQYTMEQIDLLEKETDDFDGEYMCKPSAHKDILYDREKLEAMPIRSPYRESAGFKMFYPFDPSHRYGSGHDVSGGVSLDSSTSVFIDFHTVPARVVATFRSNTIKPETFGDEVFRQLDLYGQPICAPERNSIGRATVARLKQLGANLHKVRPIDDKVAVRGVVEYGWDTNGVTKSKMHFGLAKAIQDGLLELNDADLITEAKNYNRNDLLDNEKDPRMTTRHFDLLTACAIAWQMRDFAEYKEVQPLKSAIEEAQMLYSDIGL